LKDDDMATVGFVGLGNMGGPMAANLVRAGHRVQGFDVVAAASNAAAGSGVQIVSDAASAARGADAVVTMLPSGAHVLDCYRSDDGVLANASPGTLVVDCSTIDVQDARTAHEIAAAVGMRPLDAPVSGGVIGATAATLTFMVGGDDGPFLEVRPLLEAMGRRVVHCGPAGAGQAAKVCNNLILGISMIGVCEAFVLAERLGLSHEALFDVASVSSGSCWALTANCPVPGPVPTSPANNEYRPGFAATLMLKDLRLASAAADSTGSALDLGRHATEVYEDYVKNHGGDRDFSAVIEAMREGGSHEL
jgi:3-hydroxyisobutyrate dehydrogenase